jgi:drug/metabolite transporter (DMT)-like permease
MLLLCTVFWGASFPLAKTWLNASPDCPGNELLKVLTLSLVRLILGFGLLALWQPGLFTQPSRRAHLLGAMMGALIFAGNTLSTLGLDQTTPALAAFLTSLASPLVPLVGWVLFRSRVRGVTLLGLALGVVGMAVLSIRPEESWLPRGGESLLLLATLLYALDIVLLDRWGRAESSAHFTIAAMTTNLGLSLVLTLALAAAGPGLAPWGAWIVEAAGRPDWSLSLALLALFPTVLAFHWMNAYQPRVPAARAALLYLLEPLWATFLAILCGYDTWTGALLLGGALVLLGNVVAEAPRSMSRDHLQPT